MSGRFVRASSYRHVFGTAAKKEAQFVDIRPDCTGNGQHIMANNKYFAYAGTGGGGPVKICRHDQPGRQNANAHKISVHKGKVLDFDFNPFVSNMVATTSEDCYAKVTQFPAEGLTDTINDAIVTLAGHQKKVTEAKWHPTANNVLATGSADNMIKVWDIEKQAEIANVEFADESYHMDWNTDGSLVASMNKDKKLYIVDPRQPDAAQSVDAFKGSKVCSVRWMDNHGKLGCVGFSKTSMRRLAIWDPKKLDKALHVQDIDQSAGVLIPHYDPDNSIFYVGGKGDGGIKYFEITNEAPFVFFLSEFRAGDSQKGVCFLPKRDLDVGSCEIARALRLMRDAAIPVSFQVPRKSDIFQKDIYPDTYAGKATQTADDYVAGKNAAPALMSMDPKSRDGGAEEVAVAFVAKKSPAELQAELDAALARIKELEAQLAAK
jgi:coronin-1B/1C/6